MAHSDPTFRSYKPQQAAAYASGRGSYSGKLFEHIVAYHTKNGSRCFDQVLDVGCGPGNATRDLALYFRRATGIDPGAAMIAQATETGGQTKSGESIHFEVAAAEQLSEAASVKPQSVDMITSAMAAHWFDMSQFWPQAAQVLKPGGTVALWTRASLYCHPDTPNAEKVQQILSHLEDDVLGPYTLQENRLSRDMYENLKLPWTSERPVPGFSAEDFVRVEWNRDGRLEPGEKDFFAGADDVTLARLEKALDTASAVTRWREAHPQLAGTDEDCVRVTLKDVGQAMGEDAANWQNVRMKIGAAMVLLLFTKR